MRNDRRADHLSLLTIPAAAARLGCSESHIYRLIADGQLCAVDIAGPTARRSKTRVRSDDLAAYIKACTRRVRPRGDSKPAA